MDDLGPRNYVIWSFEHHAWWKPDREGYVEDVAQAGLYSAREAGDIVTTSIWNDEVAVYSLIAFRDGTPKFHPYKGPVGPDNQGG